MYPETVQPDRLAPQPRVVEITSALETAVSTIRREIEPELPHAAFLRRHRPNPSWFPDPSVAASKDALHGIAHSASLMMLGELLCSQLRHQGIAVDSQVVRAVGQTHDLFREFEHHGQLAARWQKRHFAGQLLPLVVKKIMTVTYWHAVPNGGVPEGVRAMSEFAAFKTIDILDRVRLGEEIDVARLRIERAREHFPIIARALWQIYPFSTTGDPYEDMIQAGLLLGIVRESRL